MRYLVVVLSQKTGGFLFRSDSKVAVRRNKGEKMNISSFSELLSNDETYLRAVRNPV